MGAALENVVRVGPRLIPRAKIAKSPRDSEGENDQSSDNHLRLAIRVFVVRRNDSEVLDIEPGSLGCRGSTALVRQHHSATRHGTQESTEAGLSRLEKTDVAGFFGWSWFSGWYAIFLMTGHRRSR